MKILSIALFFVLSISNIFALEIKSEVFKDGERIPSKYTCDSIDVSPPLWWINVPEGVKSFVIICDDPDAPMGTWVHWVIFNIPVNTHKIEENIPQKGILSEGMLQGINDFRKLGYGGPCPPAGKPHRYFFKLYALDTILNLKEGATKKEVENAMKGHIITEAKIMGLYQR